MRYIEFKASGGPDVMFVNETTAPQPDTNEVLIDVAYAGINRPDLFQRMGLYPPPANASPILGLEVSGRVAAVGSSVKSFKIGDEICALTNGGGYAEQVCVPHGQCLSVPKGLSLAEAAALPETCFTVWSNVFDRGNLQSGEALLVHAGASGIGTTAIQMAAGMGAKVFTTASTDEKCELCSELGAELAINYQTEDFVSRIKEATNGQGVNVILDMVGGDYVARNIQVAALGGRIVNIAFLRGSKVSVDLAAVMMKRLTLTGSTLRPQSSDEKAGIAKQLAAKIWPLIVNKKFTPQVQHVFPLGHAAQAHQLMESNQLAGKIVLEIAV